MKQNGKETVISVLKNNKNDRANTDKNKNGDDTGRVKVIRRCTTLGVDGIQWRIFQNAVPNLYVGQMREIDFSCSEKLNEIQVNECYDPVDERQIEGSLQVVAEADGESSPELVDDTDNGGIEKGETSFHDCSYDLDNADDVIGINKEYHFLDKIQASKQKLTTLPKTIAETIDTNRVKCASIDVESLTDKEENVGSPLIRLLDLSCNYLRQVSGEITELSEWVQVLNLSNNQLSTLPKEIALMNQLEEIDVSYNLLKQIPRSVYKVRELKYLFAKCNNISAVDKELRFLKKLVLLDLSHNNIRAWPYPVLNFSTLVELNLSNNKIPVIPFGVHFMNSLRVLRLRGNLITKFTKRTRPPSLEILDLGENKIQIFPDFDGCTQLKQVWVDHNFIQQVEVDSFLSTSICFLCISNNKVNEIKGNISALDTLKVLDLSNNKLTNLPVDLGCTEKLKILRVENNCFDDPNIAEYNKMGTKYLVKYLLKNYWGAPDENNECSMYSQYTVVDRYDPIDRYTYANDCLCIRLTVNVNGHFHNWMFKRAEQEEIMRLDLSNNNIVQLPSHLWRTAPYLEELFLDMNKLTSLPSYMGNFRKLRVLILRKNKLKTLPPRMSQCEQLHLLDISRNRFRELPSVIHELKSLKILYANDNKITQIDRCYERFSHLDVLDLSNNRIEVIS